MALRDLSDPGAVVAAMAEYDRIGREAFLAKYGFGQSYRYQVMHERASYDSKALAAAAHQYQFGHSLKASEFSGGVGPTGAARKLQELGFTVVTVAADHASPALAAGEVYTWHQLATSYGFAEKYFSIAGGMISCPTHDALLLITHPDGARSIDYGDVWDGDELIYTGRGKTGDQQLVGPNRDVAENRRELHVFELAGPRRLRYLGQAHCVESGQEIAPDVNNTPRRVFRFRLRFATKRSVRLGTRQRPVPTRRMAVTRPFDPLRRPRPPKAGTQQRTPEQTAALVEKAVQGHHEVLVVLHHELTVAGWRDLGETDAIDLWGYDPDGARTIFEVKTVRDGTERTRVRAAVAQLLEYRFHYGSESDRLCLVTDQPISRERVAFLSSLQIAVVDAYDNALFASSSLARALLGAAVQPTLTRQR